MGCACSVLPKEGNIKQSVTDRCEEQGVHYGHELHPNSFVNSCKRCNLILDAGATGYKCCRCENEICQRCFSKWKVYTDKPTKSKKKTSGVEKKKDAKEKAKKAPPSRIVVS
jgi:hypothetical protein